MTPNTMTITFLGLSEKEGHLRFDYRITIGKETTSYFTGIGWCEKRHKEGTKQFSVPTEHRHAFARVFKAHGNLSVFDLPDIVYRREPTPSDVAECLLSDIEAGSKSFNDFCDDFGYSDDSLKALDTYRACMDTARKFKRADLIACLTPEQKADLGIEGNNGN